MFSEFLIFLQNLCVFGIHADFDTWPHWKGCPLIAKPPPSLSTFVRIATNPLPPLRCGWPLNRLPNPLSMSNWDTQRPRPIVTTPVNCHACLIARKWLSYYVSATRAVRDAGQFFWKQDGWTVYVNISKNWAVLGKFGSQTSYKATRDQLFHFPFHPAIALLHVFSIRNQFISNLMLDILNFKKLLELHVVYKKLLYKQPSTRQPKI